MKAERDSRPAELVITYYNEAEKKVMLEVAHAIRQTFEDVTVEIQTQDWWKV